VANTSSYFFIPIPIFLTFNKVKECISEVGTFMQQILPTAPSDWITNVGGWQEGPASEHEF
jgi:hypothetical protein